MVLRVSLAEDGISDPASGLLHPGLPVLLLSSQLGGGRRDGRAGRGQSHGFCQPRASASNPDAASSSRGKGSSSSSASNRNSSSGTSSSIRHSISFPRPPGGAVGLGIGVGGGIYAGGGGAAKATSLMPYSSAPPEKESSSEGGPKRLLIMMSNTGGGHRASAEAIRDAFQEKYGDEYQVDIVDMWKDHTPWPFNKMPDTYAFLVKHSILWRISYQMTQPKWFHVPYLAFVGIFMRSGLHRAFDKYQPDAVVSVHPLMQHVPLKVLKQRVHSGAMKPLNFATVVTDFTTCHNTWFHTGATRCFVPTDHCAGLAKQNGLVEQQLIQRGLPIRPLFSRSLPGRRAMRRRLGLDSSLPAILLVGGGEGMGALEATVAKLGQELGPTAQVVVVCGRNKRLFEKLSTSPPPGGMPVKATGFVNNIHEWMGACDCIITKAGPGTIAEALISGLPILLNGNVPCQEEGNIPYVIQNGVGAFETQPAKIATIIKSWLSGSPQEQEAFAGMARRAKELGRPMAVYEITEDLKQLTDTPDFEFGPARAALRRLQDASAKSRSQQQQGGPAFPPAATAAAAHSSAAAAQQPSLTPPSSSAASSSIASSSQPSSPSSPQLPAGPPPASLTAAALAWPSVLPPPKPAPYMSLLSACSPLQTTNWVAAS